MNLSKWLMILALLGSTSQIWAQNISTRSAEFQIDLKNNRNGDVPIITWEDPIPEINFSQDGRFTMKLKVVGNSPITAVSIDIIDTETGESKGMQKLIPEAGSEYNYSLSKGMYLLEGSLKVQVTAENGAGIKTTSSKKVYVGEEAIANVSRLDRTDYALLFATDEYEYWNDLVNPIFDSRTIAEILRKDYRFEVEIVENASQTEVLSKIREYAQRSYKPMDQLFIFFAGHGSFDQTFGEGFVVTRESLLNDEGKTSYLSHNRLRSIINNIPSEHIFLGMDVCFGGTFDEALASARGADNEIYREQAQSEFITRKLLSKTRAYLTSGGKTYVSDGIPGEHSPFAKKFIEALNSKGGNDGILTLPELFTYVEKLKIQPRMGAFGDNAPNSDFLFIVK